MSYSGVSRTKFGRYQIPEPLRAKTLHLHQGEALKEIDHEPPIPVMDQEDLFNQGIFTSQLVPGAKDVDALGSCTCNAGIASLAERLATGTGLGLESVKNVGMSLTDSAINEKFAITLYHQVTTRTGSHGQEWPPIDCGSTGLHVCQELENLELIKRHRTTHDIYGLVSLLQSGTVIMGSPWFNAWMDPDANGFVDGRGTVDDLNNALKSGVAGGHETCISAVECLKTWGTEKIDLQASHVRVRNSWSDHWGDNGSYRIHLSTLQYLGSHVDWKQFVV